MYRVPTYSCFYTQPRRIVHKTFSIINPTQRKKIIIFVDIPQKNPNNDFLYKCSLCKINTVTALKDLYPDTPKKHLKILHYKLDHKDQLLSCVAPACEEVFVWKCEMQKHYKRHHLKHRYQCEHCDKSFSFSVNFRYHQESVHPEKLNKSFNFSCPFPGCSARFTSSATLQIHKGSKHSQPRKPKRAKICPICQKALNNLPEHMKNVHCDVADRLPCEACGLTFSNKRLLKKHKEKAHMGIQCKKACKICGKIIAERRMKQHIEVVHDKVRHSCSQCDKSYVLAYDLRCHVRSVHQGQKFDCRVCKMDFGRPADRNRHEKQCHGIG